MGRLTPGAGPAGGVPPEIEGSRPSIMPTAFCTSAGINAFRHSGAKRIEMELKYTANRLSMLVRDDGRGIEPDVLRGGREGHWGLSVMRERAERIGAQLQLFSSATGGTEIVLNVPGHLAFEDHRNGRRK